MSQTQSAKEQWYLHLVEKLTPKSEMERNLMRSFWVGGVICAVGQGISLVATGPMLLSREDAAAFTAIVLVFLASLLTGLGVYGIGSSVIVGLIAWLAEVL